MVAKEVSVDPCMWNTPVIPELGRLRQEDHELEVSLSYIVRP
jgi:hypothetical protein